jgi:Spy/CpxP family protein refolding chaperone
MKARHSWASAAILTLVLIPASAALAQPGPSQKSQEPGEAGSRRGGPGLHQRMGRVGPMAGLDLTDAQKARFAEIRKDGEAKRTDLRKQLMRLRNDMRGEMLKDNLDRRKIVALAENIGSVQARLGVHRAEQMLAMREMLTPEQRDKWLTRPHRGKRGMHGMRGKGGRMQRAPGGDRSMKFDRPARPDRGGDEI